MIAKDSTYVVMGILNTDSIAYATGRLIETLGGKVIWTAQNERMKKIFFDRGCKDLSEEVKSSMDFRYCDVTVKEEVEALFASTGAIDGVLHSIAYANPKTCLGGKCFIRMQLKTYCRVFILVPHRWQRLPTSRFLR